ncbi:hypothetical protein C461_02056 [Halorubrum aidingense JCM 13560]|uniref:Uncharacterized protein n=3 Tax=Halorubrum TaxID=56688 RepID=M0PJ80_9EURY|nr:hypothetical protein C461_02056 [Halorubrum aidingense JCM 13560]
MPDTAKFATASSGARTGDLYTVDCELEGMGDEDTDGPMSAEEFRSLRDGLVRQSSGGGTTVYKNAAGVGCPNPDCDRGVFQTLFVSDHGWQQIGATRDGIDLCLCNTETKRLVFIHDE